MGINITPSVARILTGGSNRGSSINIFDVNGDKVFDSVWFYEKVQQIDNLKFCIGGGVHHSVWEWLINSPYEVKMTSSQEIEFLDPAGAVAFKLMFVEGPKDGTSGSNAT